VFGDASAFRARIAPLTRTWGRLSSGAPSTAGRYCASRMFNFVLKFAGMVEWQTLTSQKRLPERACGFESRFRHRYRSSLARTENVSGSSDTLLMHPRAIVDRARHLSQQGLIDREVAQRVGVSIGAVQKWRTGIRRGPGTERKPGCPRCDGQPLDEPAYSYLLGLYLGDGYISVGGDRAKAVWKLSILCDDAWPGLFQECARAIQAVRPGNKVLRVQRQGCTEVRSCSRHWPCLFPQHGPGKKHMRKIELAAWQQVIIERHPGEFARGFSTRTGIEGLTGSGGGGGNATVGTSTRVTCSSMSPRTSCGSVVRRWTGLVWSGDSRSRIRSRWRSVRPWRGWTSSSGRSTDCRGRCRCGRSWTGQATQRSVPLRRFDLPGLGRS
jgi:hypothetical protein